MHFLASNVHLPEPNCTAFLLVLKQFYGREFCHTVYLRDSISLLRYQTEDDSLPSYLANKKDMKLDFEQNPTVLKGVKCLEQELNQGQTFLKQSKRSKRNGSTGQ